MQFYSRSWDLQIPHISLQKTAAKTLLNPFPTSECNNKINGVFATPEKLFHFWGFMLSLSPTILINCCLEFCHHRFWNLDKGKLFSLSQWKFEEFFDCSFHNRPNRRISKAIWPSLSYCSEVILRQQRESRRRWRFGSSIMRAFVNDIPMIWWTFCNPTLLHFLHSRIVISLTWKDKTIVNYTKFIISKYR